MKGVKSVLWVTWSLGDPTGVKGVKSVLWLTWSLEDPTGVKGFKSVLCLAWSLREPHWGESIEECTLVNRVFIFHSYWIHSDEGLTLETSVFKSFTVANLPYRPCGW